MGLINKILPSSLKPLSRDIGFILRSIVYTFKGIGKRQHPNPVLIIGNQKSGTSAIAALLGALTKEKTSIDLILSGFKPSLLTQWKKGNISTSRFIKYHISDFASKIIKEPHLSVFYKEISSYYNECQIVMVVRNPFDNIRSILDRLNIKGNMESLDHNEYKKVFHSWKLLFDNSWIGGEREQYIEVLAERWNIITTTFLENKDNIILIKYEDFINNKELTIDKLAKTLNIEAKSKISHLVNKQYQPRGKQKNMDIKEFFGEKNYNRIKDICKNNMNKLSY